MKTNEENTDKTFLQEKSTGGKYIPPHLRNLKPESSQPVRNERKFPEEKKPLWSNTRPQMDEKPVSSRWKDSSPSDRFKGYNSSSGYGSSRYVEDKEDAIFGDAKTTNTGINFEKYNDIPVEISGDDWKNDNTMNSFEDFEVDKKLHDNVVRSNYKNPTPIQKYATPVVMNGRDLMACAITGSGKTCAFLYGIINRMMKEGTTAPSQKCVNPTCVILSPTRELTMQIHSEAKKFCFKTGIIPQVVYGGEEVREQLKEIFKGCDILVATPGRLLDLIERGKVCLANVKHFVLDEADKMLDMGFEPQIRQIIEKEDLPQTGKRQTLMFSATFPREIQGLAQDFLENYIFVTIGTIGATSQYITQKIEWVEERDKKETLLGLVKNNTAKTLVFVETKKSADELEYFLTKAGIKSDSIHGDRTQEERKQSLDAFKKSKIDVLVATSVAARGLDIKEVAHVINYDLPNACEDYVHRIGRTGRAGHDGLATSFFTEKNRGILKDLYTLLTDADQEIPSWMDKEMDYSGRSSGYKRGGRGRGRGGSSFNSRDVRSKNQENGSDKPSNGSSHGSSSGYSRKPGNTSSEGTYKWK